jgi:hypothetical protein
MTPLYSPLSRDASILRLHEKVMAFKPASRFAWKERAFPEFMGTFMNGTYRISQRKTFTNLWAACWEATLEPWKTGTVITLTRRPDPSLPPLQRAYFLAIGFGWGFVGVDAYLLGREAFRAGFPPFGFIALVTLAIFSSIAGLQCARRYPKLAEAEEIQLRQFLIETLDIPQDNSAGQQAAPSPQTQ